MNRKSFNKILLLLLALVMLGILPSTAMAVPEYELSMVTGNPSPGATNFLLDIAQWPFSPDVTIDEIRVYNPATSWQINSMKWLGPIYYIGQNTWTRDYVPTSWNAIQTPDYLKFFPATANDGLQFKYTITDVLVGWGYAELDFTLVNSNFDPDHLRIAMFSNNQLVDMEVGQGLPLDYGIPVPLPGAWLLLGSGLAALGARRRWKRA